jgi:hypothetical protein
VKNYQELFDLEPDELNSFYAKAASLLYFPETITRDWKLVIKYSFMIWVSGTSKII